jgi:hypothetical protein
MRVLARAKKQREIRSDADLDSMADFFESTLAGIRMAAKAGKSRHALRNIAAFASRAYTASDRRITPRHFSAEFRRQGLSRNSTAGVRELEKSY